MFTLVTSEDIAESASHSPIQRCLQGVQRRNKVQGTGIVGCWRAVCVTALQRPNSDAAAIDIVVASRTDCERRPAVKHSGDVTAVLYGRPALRQCSEAEAGGQTPELSSCLSSAIEHGSSGLLGKMSLPIGMHRRTFSYDDVLEDTAPMSPPPSDMCSNTLWRDPVIPERKYQKLSKVEDGDNGMPPPALPTSVEKAPVVKAKATSVIMNSLITICLCTVLLHWRSIHRRAFSGSSSAGLRDAGYTPHKGLTAEETKYHRVAEALHKLKMQSGDSSEEKRSASAQSTPSSTPSSSPKQTRRSWFSQGSTTSLPGDMQNSDAERWSIFGPRVVQKSTTDPGGFTVQTYKGAQKPTPMELMRAQANRIGDDPVASRPPKMEMPPLASENRKVNRGHNLQPRDMNILTPTGF
ncbi:unnamed protein product [Ranitomeya imitator]|uniref:Putative monooxygenase p33MONOX n=1 Tax=Ranitomeya imitator TaxID=111125 RepID=A0ABN9ML78_9NEOB|nr:unnamed protein product [Ranitomeya imitator]